MSGTGGWEGELGVRLSVVSDCLRQNLPVSDSPILSQAAQFCLRQQEPGLSQTATAHGCLRQDWGGVV